MRGVKAIKACAMALSVSGCATTSFAPPNVNLSKQTTVTSEAGRSCLSQITVDNTVPITSSVAGARTLVNNFINVYRCQAHGAANGRQVFEVPALLAAAGVVTAAALGAGPDVAIIGGASGSVLANGKRYYSPLQKASFYNHALDALLCIKTEAVGIAAFDTTAANNLLKGGNDGSIRVNVEDQYFDMVSAALFSVERILAQRLSASGTFDPAGLVAEIKALQEEVESAEAIKNAATAPTSTSTENTTETGTEARGAAYDKSNDVLTTPAETEEAGHPLFSSSVGSSDLISDYAILDLKVLHPKLQQCVVRAKL